MLRKEMNTHRGVMQGLAFNIVKDMDLAEDYVQDAMIRALTRLHQFDASKSKFSTWLCQIVINVCMQHNIAAKKMTKVDLELVHLSEAESETGWDQDDLLDLLIEIEEHVRTFPQIVDYDLADDFIAYYSSGKIRTGGKSRMYNLRVNVVQPRRHKTYDQMAKERNMEINTLKTVFMRTKVMLRERMGEKIAGYFTENK